MDFRSLTSLLLRLTGVLMIVGPAVSVPHTFVQLLMLASANGAADLTVVSLQTWLLTALAAAFPMIIGAFLLYFPATVANGIVAGITDDGAQDARYLTEIAFSILGLYFLATAMFDATYWCAKLRLYPALFEPLSTSRPQIPDRDFAGMVSTGVQFVAGLALLLHGCRLADIVRRLRSRLDAAHAQLSDQHDPDLPDPGQPARH